MLNTIIFDYMGVLANVDYKKLLKQLPITDHIKALRLYCHSKKDEYLKVLFEGYQSGMMTSDEFSKFIIDKYPKIGGVVPKTLQLLPTCISENKPMVSLAKKLHDDGFKIVLLSNSIPETQETIQNSSFVEFFDGFVLSNMVGSIKPNREIFDIACETYNINPNDTLFVDDKQTNLNGAEELKFKTMLGDNSKKFASRLGNLFYSRYEPEPNE